MSAANGNPPRSDRALISDETAREMGRALLSGLALDPARVPAVLEILEPSDLREPAFEAVFRAIVALHAAGQPIDEALLGEQLDGQGQLGLVGGYPALAEILEFEATPEYVLHYARRLRKHALERRARELYEAIATGRSDVLLQKLREVETAIAAVESGSCDLGELGLTGARLERVRAREERLSPLPGLLDPEPGLTVLIGKPKTAKTRFALSLALAWACGERPWDAAPVLPGSRVLVISAEQPARRIEQTLRQLEGVAGLSRDRWTEQIVLVARDPELPAAGEPLLSLSNTGGLTTLRDGLATAKRAGRPFGVVVLDSLSRLKPAEVEENDNDAMSTWLGRLQEIAEEAGAYLVLIHHRGFSERDEARTAGRGASAIAAVAQVAWLLEDVPGNARMRRLHVQGNAVLASQLHFEVAGEKSAPGEVLYFRPVDPTEGHRLEDLVEPGEELSISGLAWRIAGRDPRDGKDRPPGNFVITARELRKRWEVDGLVETFTKGQAQMLRRKAEAETCQPS
jgi:hypothetical protein